MNIKRLMTNDNGMVMILVLLVVIVIMTLSASILSTSLNQNLTSQAQVDAIKAEQLGKGYFWKDQSSGVFTNSTTNVSISTTDPRQYRVVVEEDTTNTVPNTTKYKYTVQY